MHSHERKSLKLEKWKIGQLCGDARGNESLWVSQATAYTSPLFFQNPLPCQTSFNLTSRCSKDEWLPLTGFAVTWTEPTTKLGKALLLEGPRLSGLWWPSQHVHPAWWFTDCLLFTKCCTVLRETEKKLLKSWVKSRTLCPKKIAIF